MASDVDICNLALSHLGDEAGVVAIVPPDGTQQAAYCGTYFPLARDLMLELHPWTFATKRATIAQIDNPLPDDWSFAYAIPSTCMRPLSLLSPGIPAQYLGTDTDIGSHPFIVEAGEDGSLVLYTNVEGAALRYIDRIEDPNLFTPSFVASLSHLLASYLAGPILKGGTGMDVSLKQFKLFEAAYAKAVAINANSGRRNAYETRVPSFIAARGGLTRL